MDMQFYFTHYRISMMKGQQVNRIVTVSCEAALLIIMSTPNSYIFNVCCGLNISSWLSLGLIGRISLCCQLVS